MAVLNTLGLLTGFREFLSMALEVDPATAFSLLVLFTAMITSGLVIILPKAMLGLAFLPAATFAAYWLSQGWGYFIRKSESITEANVLLIHLATLALGLCMACHSTIDGKKPTTSQRSVIFIAFALIANACALFLTACLHGYMEEVKQKSIQQVTLEQKVLMAPVSNEATGNSLITKSQPESNLTAK